MIDHNLVTVFCDENADKNLFILLKQHSENLRLIPDSNVTLLPKGNELHSEKLKSISYLATYDRPDYIFLYKGIPVLVVELTEHGYTGDNPLQRFTRFATTAENHLPFIYFTPFSRVRDDELDDVNLEVASKRKVNTNVWKGMTRLSEIYDVPQIAVDWCLSDNGKPLKLSFSPTGDEIKIVFGELIDKISYVLNLSEKIISNTSILTDKVIKKEQDKVKELWLVGNTRATAGKEIWDRETIKSFITDQKVILEKITQSDYFYKDKPERLIALECILTSQIEYTEGIEGSNKPANIILNDILNHEVFNKPLVYYSGYKWRSDPHCGVAVNLDYIFCRNQNGKTPSDRSSALVLYWPRIYFNSDSKAYKRIKNEFELIKSGRGELYDLFVERYVNQADAQDRINHMFNNNSKENINSLVGIWNETTKQSRIFREYCDLIILADAILIGNHWNKNG